MDDEPDLLNIKKLVNLYPPQYFYKKTLNKCVNDVTYLKSYVTHIF
jgi:hypothetical protein